MTAARPKIKVNKHNESAELIARLLACIPAATFEMETLCRLAGIKASRAIPTAAVECVYRPRMLLNPDFVAKHCAGDEHLFLLVMHELWHIILAHTRLYPRATLAHNIAFDAIINAGLARQFNRPEYRGFFETLNPGDQFPGCLLRPPEGWPHDPQYPDAGPPGTREIIQQLYPKDNASRWSAPLYEEILNLLRDYIRDQIAKGEIILEPFLLGDHDNPANDSWAMDDPFMGDVIRRVTKSWPAPPFAVGRNGAGGAGADWAMVVGQSSEDARRAFVNVLKRCLGPRYGSMKRRARSPIPGMAGMNVLPNPRDRLASARQLLGVQGTLWGQPGIVRARLPETPSRSHIYLDVSGSMSQHLSPLLGLILPYVANGQALVYQFSTIVESLPLERLRPGKLRTTQGTDINCVLAHVLAAKPSVRRVLILTDGYTGKPHLEYARQLAERGIRIYAVIPAETSWTHDLKGIARSLTILPPLRPRSGWRPS
jgi:hypothetical protein